MTTQTPTRPTNSSDSRSFPEATKVLDECCEQKTVCRFLLIHNGYSTSATVQKLHPQGLELKIAAEDKGEPLLANAICCVTFTVGPTICAFLGHLIDVRLQKTGERRVVISHPKQLTATNLRRSFRVPVIKESGLETLVRTSYEKQFTVQARDITTAGIEIEFPSGDVPVLETGMILDVELRFRGEVFQRKGEVRRAAGKRCGLLFQESSEEQNGREDSQMNGLVLTLQQLWLKNRIK